MRVTSVMPFASEIEAWQTLGRSVLWSAEVTWSRERAMLYFSRFYHSDRGRPSVVVVGLTMCSELARMSGGESVQRLYRGCGYPWPYNMFVPRPVCCWRSPTPMPSDEPTGGWESAMEALAYHRCGLRAWACTPMPETRGHLTIGLSRSAPMI